MGQYWLLLNVDKRQTGQGVSGKFPEFIFNGHSWLVRLLARPGPEFNEPVPAYYVSPPSSDKTELGSLSRIPMELIAAIFSSISSSDDAVCLAAAHRVLAPEGFRRLLELRREECRYWGSWAGDRLITSGDYARTPPAGMLLPAEAEELGEATLFDYAYYAYEHYEQSPPLFRDLFYMHQGEKIATKVTWQRVSKEDQPGDHLRDG
ncbi:hypothetical protein PENSPDRAFT_115930 [Peniophora sp. CONT]|nr:hypothetical protein PENSPDRAFT_115930 [Peniophora sp. CONT]